MSSTTEDIIADLEIPWEIDTLEHKDFEDKWKMKELFDVMKTWEKPINITIVNPTNDMIQKIMDQIREKKQKKIAWIMMEIWQNLLRHSKDLPESNILKIYETKEKEKEYVTIKTENFFKDINNEDAKKLKAKLDEINWITNSWNSREEIEEQLKKMDTKTLLNWEMTKWWWGWVWFIEIARKIYELDPEKKEIFKIKVEEGKNYSDLKISVKIPKEKPKIKKEKAEEIPAPQEEKISKRRKELLQELEGDMILSINNIQALHRQSWAKRANEILWGSWEKYPKEIEIALIDEYLQKVEWFNKSWTSKRFNKHPQRQQINQASAEMIQNMTNYGIIQKPCIFQIKEHKTENWYMCKLMSMNYFSDPTWEKEKNIGKLKEKFPNINYHVETQKDGIKKCKIIISIPMESSLQESKN